ncbi:MAG: YhbY family RNA-binding protein [Gemmatimonadota bacterium]|nr:YhbY family RNA-binding protein [Gemmatimonadota bacterium]
MPLSSKERAELRAEAHHLSADVQVGHQGITPTLVQALDDALRARELVKVQLSKNADETPKALANRLAKQVGADVVQVIGRTATFYRENPELERKPGAGPPWRA